MLVDPLQNIEIKPEFYFPCGVYSFIDTQYIDMLSNVSSEHALEAHSGLCANDVYPVTQTNNFVGDDRIGDFKTVLGHAAWKILESQGYEMSSFDISINELWFQEHRQYSGHDVHIHGNHGQLTGFYFLETPEDSVRALIHDPRPAKVYASLPEKNINDVSLASSIINFVPQPCMFLFMNTWMPHSFTRNQSEKPVKFIHFNIGVISKPFTCKAEATVI